MLILLATVGMMLMISANDIISLYVGLELQSLALYVLAAFNLPVYLTVPGAAAAPAVTAAPPPTGSATRSGATTPQTAPSSRSVCCRGR